MVCTWGIPNRMWGWESDCMVSLRVVWKVPLGPNPCTPVHGTKWIMMYFVPCTSTQEGPLVAEMVCYKLTTWFTLKKSFPYPLDSSFEMNSWASHKEWEVNKVFPHPLCRFVHQPFWTHWCLVVQVVEKEQGEWYVRLWNSVWWLHNTATVELIYWVHCILSLPPLAL